MKKKNIHHRSHSCHGRESLLNCEPILAEKKHVCSNSWKGFNKVTRKSQANSWGQIEKNQWFPFASYETLIFEGGYVRGVGGPSIIPSKIEWDLTNRPYVSCDRAIRYSSLGVRSGTVLLEISWTIPLEHTLPPTIMYVTLGIATFQCLYKNISKKKNVLFLP